MALSLSGSFRGPERWALPTIAPCGVRTFLRGTSPDPSVPTGRFPFRPGHFGPGAVAIIAPAMNSDLIIRVEVRSNNPQIVGSGQWEWAEKNAGMGVMARFSPWVLSSCELSSWRGLGLVGVLNLRVFPVRSSGRPGRGSRLRRCGFLP